MTDFYDEFRACKYRCNQINVDDDHTIKIDIPSEKLQSFIECYRKNDLEKMDAQLKNGDISCLTMGDFLIKSVKDKRSSVTDMLLKYGANVNVCAVGHGHAALQLAAINQNLDLVAKLLELGADIHYDDDALLKNLNYKFDGRVVGNILECYEPRQYNMRHHIFHPMSASRNILCIPNELLDKKIFSEIK